MFFLGLAVFLSSTAVFLRPRCFFLTCFFLRFCCILFSCCFSQSGWFPILWLFSSVKLFSSVLSGCFPLLLLFFCGLAAVLIPTPCCFSSVCVFWLFSTSLLFSPVWLFFSTVRISFYSKVWFLFPQYFFAVFLQSLQELFLQFSLFLFFIYPLSSTP